RALAPLDEEGQLRIGERALDADLLPQELTAVGQATVARDGLAVQALLDLFDLGVDADDPAHPAATGLGAGAHDLAEGGLVGARVVEDLDDLDITLVGERQDHVARAETRVDPPIDSGHAKCLAQTLGCGLDTGLVCSI